jgi:hypothetical protein
MQKAGALAVDPQAQRFQVDRVEVVEDIAHLLEDLHHHLVKEMLVEMVLLTEPIQELEAVEERDLLVQQRLIKMVQQVETELLILEQLMLVVEVELRDFQVAVEEQLELEEELRELAELHPQQEEPTQVEDQVAQAIMVQAEKVDLALWLFDTRKRRSNHVTLG